MHWFFSQSASTSYPRYVVTSTPHDCNALLRHCKMPSPTWLLTTLHLKRRQPSPAISHGGTKPNKEDYPSTLPRFSSTRRTRQKITPASPEVPVSTAAAFQYPARISLSLCQIPAIFHLFARKLPNYKYSCTLQLLCLPGTSVNRQGRVKPTPHTFQSSHATRLTTWEPIGV